MLDSIEQHDNARWKAIAQPRRNPTARALKDNREMVASGGWHRRYTPNELATFKLIDCGARRCKNRAMARPAPAENILKITSTQGLASEPRGQQCWTIAALRSYADRIRTQLAFSVPS